MYIYIYMYMQRFCLLVDHRVSFTLWLVCEDITNLGLFQSRRRFKICHLQFMWQIHFSWRQTYEDLQHYKTGVSHEITMSHFFLYSECRSMCLDFNYTLGMELTFCNIAFLHSGN